MTLKEIRINGAVNPDTHEVVWGVCIRKPDLNWKTLYAAESYDRNGLREAVDFVKAFLPEVEKVLYCGYETPVAVLDAKLVG